MLSNVAELVDSGEYRKAWSIMVDYESMVGAGREAKTREEEGGVQLMMQNRQYKQLRAVSTILTFHAERRYWEALGIDPHCNSYRVSRVHCRYRELAGLVHPDTCQVVSKEVAKRAFIALKASRDAVLLGIEDQLHGNQESSEYTSAAEARGYEWWSIWDDDDDEKQHNEVEQDDDECFLRGLEVETLRVLVRKREEELWNGGGEGSVQAMARARSVLAEKLDSSRHSWVDQQQGGFL